MGPGSAARHFVLRGVRGKHAVFIITCERGISAR